jgi:hypothetical protein
MCIYYFLFATILFTGFVWNGLWILELAVDDDKRVKIEGDVELDINPLRPRDVRSDIRILYYCVKIK